VLVRKYSLTLWKTVFPTTFRAYVFDLLSRLVTIRVFEGTKLSRLAAIVSFIPDSSGQVERTICLFDLV
jgi:hypothetical protein